MNLYVQEDYIKIERHNEEDERRSRIGDSGDPCETKYETPGKLYKALLKEHGRCISKVYVDIDSTQKQIGWVFLKRRPYDDTPRETFLCETWVTVHSGAPTRTIKYDYVYLNLGE